MRVALRSALVVGALVAAFVAGCTSTGTTTVTQAPGPAGPAATTGASGAGSASGTAPSTSALSADLSAALATLPATTTQSQFTDDAAMKKRWGVADVTSATPTTSTQFRTYTEQAGSAQVNPLVTYAAAAQGSSFSGLDVDWSISSTPAGQPPSTVYGMRPGLDMSAVAAGLTKIGFSRSGPDAQPVFTLAPANASGAVPFLSAVLVPDRHLLITGGNTTAVLATIAGQESALATDPAITSLLLDYPSPEFLALNSGAAACVHPKLPVSGLSGTHPPQQVAAMTLDDHRVVVALEFADEAAAAADAPTRAALMTSGRSERTKEPYSALFAVDSTAVRAAVVSYHLTLRGHPTVLGTMIAAADTPWAFCS